jgi:hypothetical protein
VFLHNFIKGGGHWGPDAVSNCYDCLRHILCFDRDCLKPSLVAVMSTSHINDPEHWRDQAGKMRQLAYVANNAQAREDMLSLARDYDLLAKRAHNRANGLPSSN